MVGYDDYSKTIKHYRVDKMLKPHATNEKREGAEEAKDLDMAAYSKATFGMYGGEKKRVKLHLHNKMAGVFIDRFGRDITFRPTDEKHSELVRSSSAGSSAWGRMFRSSARRKWLRK